MVTLVRNTSAVSRVDINRFTVNRPPRGRSSSRDQLRTYAQRLRHARVESGQLLPAAALQPLIGPNGALMWTEPAPGRARCEALTPGWPLDSPLSHPQDHRPARVLPRTGSPAGSQPWTTSRRNSPGGAHVVDVEQRLRRPTAPKKNVRMTTAGSKPPGRPVSS